MPKRFDQDTKDRVGRLIEERIARDGCSVQAASQEIAPKLGVSWHWARHWVQIARKAGLPARDEEDVIAENARLRAEVAELRDVNELLRAASASPGNSTRNVGHDPVY